MALDPNVTTSKKERLVRTIKGVVVGALGGALFGGSGAASAPTDRSAVATGLKCGLTGAHEILLQRRFAETAKRADRLIEMWRTCGDEKAKFKDRQVRPEIAEMAELFGTHLNRQEKSQLRLRIRAKVAALPRPEQKRICVEFIRWQKLSLGQQHLEVRAAITLGHRREKA